MLRGLVCVPFKADHVMEANGEHRGLEASEEKNAMIVK